MKKKNKKRLLILVLTLMLAGILAMTAACASSYAPLPPSKEDAGWDYGEESLRPQPPADIRPGESTGGPVERKFIQNGTLILRSSDIQKTYESLVSLAQSLGGRVVAYQQLTDGDIKWISLQVAVPFGRLDDFMEAGAREVTKIESKSVSSEEVTEAYYDVKTRIGSTEDLIAHYRTLLARAETIEDTLMVQTRIDDLTLELESLKGRLQVLDSLTMESRIDITIRMETDPTITKPEVTWKTLKWSDVGFLMKSGIQKVGIAIVLAFQYFLVFLVYASPLILLAVLIIILILILRRRKRKKMARKALEVPAGHPGLGQEEPGRE